MLVDNQPLAIGLAIAGGPPQPTITRLAILHGSTHPVEAMSACHVIACSEAQIANLVANRILV
jgi:hypothetical protein